MLAVEADPLNSMCSQSRGSATADLGSSGKVNHCFQNQVCQDDWLTSVLLDQGTSVQMGVRGLPVSGQGRGQDRLQQLET